MLQEFNAERLAASRSIRPARIAKNPNPMVRTPTRIDWNCMESYPSATHHVVWFRARSHLELSSESETAPHSRQRETPARTMPVATISPINIAFFDSLYPGSTEFSFSISRHVGQLWITPPPDLSTVFLLEHVNSSAQIDAAQPHFAPSATLPRLEPQPHHSEARPQRSGPPPPPKHPTSTKQTTYTHLPKKPPSRATPVTKIENLYFICFQTFAKHIP